MNKLIIAALGLGMLAALPAAGQQADNRQPPGGENRPGPTETLTEAQVAQVKAILAKYDATTLTADQAKAIHEAFRQGGLRGGPAMNDAVKAAGFDPDKLRDLAPPPGQAGGGGERQPGSRQGAAQADGSQRSGTKTDGTRRSAAKTESPGGDQPLGGDNRGGQRGQDQYSIEQAVSDRAQLNTIAFDGLTFLTGDFGCNTFLPPGKVADFCGFQYMRDVDSNRLGHNTSFVPRVANNVLYILTDEQKAKLIALGQEQEKLLTDFAQKRFPLIKAFCRQLAGDIPPGSAGLSRKAVMKYASGLYELDGLLSTRRAEVLGGIVRSLTDKQKDYLAKMAFNNSATWPELQDQVDKQSLSHTAHVAVMTYASEMFSWYAGNLEADVYFCPERHATYFGAFYMKDMPAMGNPSYSISTSLTGDSGEAFLAALTESQRKLITGLVDQQRADLAEIVNTRRAIATELRRFIKETSVDKDKVLALSRRYGELDGEIAYFYAMAFAKVAETLTADQKKTLLKLRNLDAKYACKGAYLYSRAIAMPEVPNTDFLFAAAGTAKAGSAARPAATAPAATAFTLRSPAVADGGQLPKEYTADGASATLPLAWSGAPAGTKSYALIMHHVDPEGKTKWYWTLYNIPADVQSLPKNVQAVGMTGNNSVNGRAAYAPPNSKGPGAKIYVYTVYALAAPVKLDLQASEVSRDVLLAAMKDRLLGSAELKVVYTRSDDDGRPGEVRATK